MNKDSENIARLETLKPKYEKLRELKIRTETELERTELDLKNSRQHAIDTIGTDNEEEIRGIIQRNYENNTKAVDDFEAKINEITSKLSTIEADGVI